VRPLPWRGLGPARLFQALVVAGRHRREFRDLVAAQTGGAPPGTGGEAEFGGGQRFAAGAQKTREFGSVLETNVHIPS
jgi:hypothetical protein